MDCAGLRAWIKKPSLLSFDTRWAEAFDEAVRRYGRNAAQDAEVELRSAGELYFLSEDGKVKSRARSPLKLMFG